MWIVFSIKIVWIIVEIVYGCSFPLPLHCFSVCVAAVTRVRVSFMLMVVTQSCFNKWIHTLVCVVMCILKTETTFRAVTEGPTVNIYKTVCKQP